METLKTISLSQIDAHRIIGLKASAYDDYMAARLLYNNNMFIQASILANTAIEKEMKAYIECVDPKVKFKHDTYKIFNRLKEINNEIAERLNPEYIKILQKIYRVRYPEQASPGFNFTIPKRKFLAELDYTYSVLVSSVKQEFPENHAPQKTTYETAIECKDPKLYDNNYLLNNILKERFIETSDIVMDYRVLIDYTSFSVRYITNKVKNDGIFDVKALVPQSDGQSFNYAYF